MKDANRLLVPLVDTTVVAGLTGIARDVEVVSVMIEN